MGHVNPVKLHDEACQTSPTSPSRDWTIATKPGPPHRKMYKTPKKTNYNGLKEHDTQMLLDQGKHENAYRVKREGQKLPLLSLRDDGDQYNEGVEHRKEGMPSGCGLRCLRSRSESRNSSSSSSAKDREQASPRKRKILQKHRGAPKKQKGSMIKTTSDLKRTAAGGANLPPSQRYNFYRNYGYGGQGAKTSKNWHSLKYPWMPS